MVGARILKSQSGLSLIDTLIVVSVLTIMVAGAAKIRDSADTVENIVQAKIEARSFFHEVQLNTQSKDLCPGFFSGSTLGEIGINLHGKYVIANPKLEGEVKSLIEGPTLVYGQSGSPLAPD